MTTRNDHRNDTAATSNVASSPLQENSPQPLWPPTTWPVSFRVVGLWLAATAVLTLLWALMGKAVVALMDGSALGDAEADLSSWLANHRTEWLNDLTHWLSYIGESMPKTIMLWIIALAFIAFWRRIDLAIVLIATLELERAAYGYSSRIVARARPMVEKLDNSPPDASFPSGHVASMTALAVLLGLIVWHNADSIRVKRAAIGFAVLWPIVSVGLRLYRGMHYASDALFGMMLGLVSVAVGVKLLSIGKADRDRRLTRAESSS